MWAKIFFNEIQCMGYPCFHKKGKKGKTFKNKNKNINLGEMCVEVALRGGYRASAPCKRIYDYTVAWHHQLSSPLDHD